MTNNPWLEHVAQFRKSHPNLANSEVYKKAKLTYKKKGGNPAIVKAALDSGVAVVGAVGDSIVKGVNTQHDFNKDNNNLSAERSKNFTKFYRDMQHIRYWDPESISPKLRLKKFGIDPPSSQNDKKNAVKLERANEALYDWCEQQIEKEQNRIDKNKYGKGKTKTKLSA